MNQIEASTMKLMTSFNLNSTIPVVTKIDILNKEFITGHQENFTQENQSFLDEFKGLLSQEEKHSFRYWARQWCDKAFISLSYQGRNLNWRQVEEDIGALHFPTDFGQCCLTVPHLSFDHMFVSNKTVEETWFNTKSQSHNGETNGLDIVLDTEQFNYAYHQANAAGFRISLHHHNSKPMISFSSQLIHAGTETIIDIKPILTFTTDQAISKFSPDERGCFTKDEVRLNHLKRTTGYHYDLNNCIIDEGIRDIIWNCRCIPNFVRYEDTQEYFEVFSYCTGKGLFCANNRTKLMGMKKISKGNDIVSPEALESPEIIGGISKPKSINCLPSCHFQDNYNQMSNAPYPQKQMFFYQKTFCDVASHVFQVTCLNEERRSLIEKPFPNMCHILIDFDRYFGTNSSCTEWPKNFFEEFEEPISTLRDELFEYGKQNLALIHVMIQSPYATKIKRDVAMTLTNYVGNTGGLLGLCLGFSFISFIEIIFWCCFCVKETRKLYVSPV